MAFLVSGRTLNILGGGLPPDMHLGEIAGQENRTGSCLSEYAPDHISEEARFQGARLITDWIASYVPDTPVIMTGDFNAGREERCYRKLNGF